MSRNVFSLSVAARSLAKVEIGSALVYQHNNNNNNKLCCQLFAEFQVWLALVSVSIMFMMHWVI
jgi:hypothetical protein